MILEHRELLGKFKFISFSNILELISIQSNMEFNYTH